ncbi:hypothetical protein IW150_004802 [Coemansia sp. RSA 2607]|nr:hypothetical protein IW150_004802 [Coemansia sp. RSA 2607]
MPGDALPFDIVCRVFVWAQRPSLGLLSRAFHAASQAQGVRARFFLVEFGRRGVLDGAVGLPARRPRMVRADLVLLLLALGADPRADAQWVVRHACAQGVGWAAVLRRLLFAQAHSQAPPAAQQGVLDGWRMLGAPPRQTLSLKPAADVHLGDDAALRIAAAHGHAPLVRLLAAAGAHMDAASGEPLVLAASAGHAECTRALLQCGADAAADQSRALRTAVLAGDANLACVRLLLSHGARADAMDHCCVLAAAYRGDGQPRAPRYARPNSSDPASGASHVLLLRLLLAHGADPNARNGRPLLFASMRGLPRAAAELVAAGADVHVGADEPLRLAAERGCLPVVRVLLDAGARVLAQDGLPLQGAARGGHVDVVRALLHAVQSPVPPEILRRALVAAARGGWRNVVELLLAAGADRDDPEFVACAAHSRDLRRALGLPPPSMPNIP